MFNARDFIEFAEKEFNIQFIDMQTGRDMETGRKVLDVFSDNEKRGKDKFDANCVNCNWAMSGNGVVLHEDDIICVNNQSEHLTDWVGEDMSCDLWEQIEGNDGANNGD